MRTLIATVVISSALTGACGNNSTSDGPPAKTGGSAQATAGMSGGGRAGSSGTAGNAAQLGSSASGGSAGTATTTSSGGVSAGGSSNHGGGAGAATSSGGVSGGAPGGGAPNGGNSAGTGAGGANTGGSATGGAPSGGAPSGGSGGAGTTCTRDSLQPFADSVGAALQAADTSKMSLATGATYTENFAAAAFSADIWQSPLVIAFRRDFLDVVTCQTFSEIVVTEGHPYVIGMRTQVASGQISEVESVITDKGDWSFDASGYLMHAMAEDWSVIPVAEQDTRDTLLAAANAYFDVFNDKTVMVPWGMPCARLEGGGAYTGTTCDVGVPSGITFSDKHFVVDQDLGTAVGLDLFGGTGGLPDVHIFRLLSGKIRYVHTLTVCTTPNCGM